MNSPEILNKFETFEVRYPWAEEFTEKQLSIFWLPEEVNVEKDKHDLLVNMSEAEREAVIEILRLFSLYERRAGSNYWMGRFMDTFKRPELQKMAATFGMFELAIHGPFYQKLNEVLGLSNDDFFLSYRGDRELNTHIEFIGKMISHRDPLISVAAFSLVEGAILYSSFAFLKHFQSAGKNKLLNVVRGINFSARDEDCHQQAGAMVFKTLSAELELDDVDKAGIEASVKSIAETIRSHEELIVRRIFSHGKIEGITELQVMNFVKSRINKCMTDLGYKSLYEIKHNPIAEWFYDGISGFSFNDQFSAIGNGYVRNWDETGFEYKEFSKEN